VDCVPVVTEAEEDTKPLTADLEKGDISSSASSVTLVQESNPTDIKDISANVSKPANDAGKAHTPKASETTKEIKDDDPEDRLGWPSRPPFQKATRKSIKDWMKEHTFWSDLTWEEKMAYHKQFLMQYISETRKCFPYVRKLFLMIYRISPWRAVIILVLNAVNGLLPAMTLRTRGSFIMLVITSLCQLNVATTRSREGEFEHQNVNKLTNQTTSCDGSGQDK
jgi:hypothetical protein